MTALSQYDRLEAPGLWRDAPDAQRVDVIATFGEATLVILDSRTGRALSHWSLPAIERRNPGVMPAVFAPAPDSPEELELDDPTMIAAIAKVRNLIEARKPHPGRLRLVLLMSGLVLVLGAALFWVPGAVKAHAARVVPQEKRIAIGQQVLTDVFRVSGAACAAPEGREALARLDARLGASDGAIIVLASGLSGARHLPGGLILVGRDLVEEQSTPDVLAGYVLAERARADALDPMDPLLDWAGVRAAFSLLTTGELPSDSIVGYAERLLTQPSATVTAKVLLPRFGEAGVPSTPYAGSGDVTETEATALKDGDPFAATPAQPVLSDSDWVALQGICAG